MASAIEALPVPVEQAEPVLAMRLLSQMSRVRIIVVFVLLHGLLATPPASIFCSSAVYGGISIAAILAISSYFVFNWRREFRSGKLNMAAAGFVIGDVVALSFFIYGMGGVSSYLYPLLLCEVVFAAFFFHRLEIVFVAGIVCCSLMLSALIPGVETPAGLGTAAVGVTSVIVLAWLAYGLGRVMQRERVLNQRIIRHLGQPVCLLGSDGRVLMVNPQLEQLASTSHAQVIGKSIAELHEDEDTGLLPALLEGVGDLPTSQAADTGNVSIENPEPITLRRTIMPCPSTTGLPVGWVIMWHDVTDLVETMRAQEIGISVVSHELRSPIACLRLLIELLGNINESDQVQRNRIVDQLMDETDRLSRLVASVLELSQFERPDFHLKREKMSPLSMIQRVTSMFAMRAKEAGIRFTCRCPSHLPELYGNEDRLEEVLINLCENAINHTPEGGEVTLQVRPSAGSLELEVRDTGVGIPEDCQEHVFDKFFSAGTRVSGPGRSAASGGLGLGLALTKRIVELHEGQIRVVSHPGAGAAFEICLPLDPPAENTAVPELVGAEAETEKSSVACGYAASL